MMCWMATRTCLMCFDRAHTDTSHRIDIAMYEAVLFPSNVLCCCDEAEEKKRQVGFLFLAIAQTRIVCATSTTPLVRASTPHSISVGSNKV